MDKTSPALHPLLRLAELRAIENAAQADLPPGTLMARAGAAAARLVTQIGNQRLGPVWILAGPGNNGGDALVVARLLAERGVPVEVALLDVTAPGSADARAARHAFQGPLRHDIEGLAKAGLIVDGLFGIGLSRALPERASAWIAALNRLSVRGGPTVPILALDVPSGLSADTGAVIGGIAVRATHTLTFIADKPGLRTLDGPDHAGLVTVDALGLDLPAPVVVRSGVSAPASSTAGVSATSNVQPPPGVLRDAGFLNAPAAFESAFQPRVHNSHKGMFGNLAVIGGNRGMTGAALLAARMALHAGAGRVYVQLLDPDAPTFDSHQPELMLRTQLDDVALHSAVIGPGLGHDMRAVQQLATHLAGTLGLVLDADALNAIGAQPALAQRLMERPANSVLTPHPLEAARLLQQGVHIVQADRVDAALRIAARFKAITVLKGAGSVIAAPDGRWAINPTGNPGLASAGTGDILAGLIGALLAQGWAAWEAALGGVWLHGRAADDLVGAGFGPVGLVASDLIQPVRRLLNGLVDA